MPDWLASVEALSQYARPGAEAREQGVLSGIRTVALWCLLPLLLAALVLPFVLRQNAWYEWANYYWLLVKQTDTIRHLGHPSYFLSYPGGLFYPQYVFYGATLWSATGYLALVTGSVWGAFLAVTLLAFAMAALLALGLIAWRAGAPPAPRRVALLAAIAAAGVLVNAWYLLPDTAYGHDTLSYLDAGRWTDVLIAFDRPGNLFYPWNHS